MAVAAGQYGAILRGLGLAPDAARIRELSAWQRAEGGPDQFNPFNTTMGAAGARSTNSAGVKSYVSAQQGNTATIETLKNGDYGGIIRALKNEDDKAFASAIGSSPWGTSGSLVASILGTNFNPNANSTESGGSKTVAHGGKTRTQFDQALFQKKAGAILMQDGVAKAQAGVDPSAPDASGNLVDQLNAARKSATVRVSNGGGADGSGSLTTAGSGAGAQAVALAAKQIGTPYVWGGESKSGFDCSGLVQYVFGKIGIQLPRTAAEQGKAGHAVSYANLKPGDLLVENNGDHVVIYAGNGRVIQAPHTGTKVQSSPLSWFPANQYFARRVD